MLFLLQLLINAAALWVAIQLVDGISHTGSWWSLMLVALVFGVINASVRPLVKLLSLPILILTLGLFIFIINALMLRLTSWVSGLLGLGFHVEGFWAAFLGGLIVSIVSLMLSIFTGARKMKVHVESHTTRT
jgi:putative membrane protein